MNPSTVRLLQRMQDLAEMIERCEITEADIVAVHVTRRPGLHLDPEKFDDCARRLNVSHNDIAVRAYSGDESIFCDFHADGIDFVTVREPSDTEKEAVPPVPEASEI